MSKKWSWAIKKCNVYSDSCFPKRLAATQEFLESN